MPASKGRKPKAKSKPNTRPTTLPVPAQKREKLCYILLKNLGTTFGWIFRVPQTGKDFLVWLSVILGIIASVAVMYDYYLQTYPEFVENNIDVSSPKALPFSIQIPSIFFEMKNPQLVCSIDYVDFLTDNGKHVGFSFPITSGVVNKANISRSSPGTFSCDAANFLHIENGEIDLLGYRANGDGLKSAQIVTHTVRIGITYTMLGTRRSAMSPPFTWEPIPNGHYWRKGEMLR
jgi:hypothetical protein